VFVFAFHEIAFPWPLVSVFTPLRAASLHGRDVLGRIVAATARNRRIGKQARQFLRDVISGFSQYYQGFTFHEE
jgi:hypothetical protein